MGKASRQKTASSRQEKVAAQRASAKRAEQKRRLYIGGGAILAVIVVKANSNSPSSASSNGPTGAALTSLVKTTTSVSPATLDQVGAGAISQGMTAKISGTPLTSNGKPEFLYMGAEYCPFCAAERWSMVVALSRFGTFSNLKTIHSSSVDNPANVPTWSFYGSSYTSQYLTFTPVEMQTNIPSGNSYPTLQAPTSAQQALLAKWDAPPYVTAANAGAIPFIYIDGKYLQVGDQSGLDATSLTGLSWSQIGADLSQPSSAVAQQIDGAANYLTAAICSVTNNADAAACTSTIQGLEGKL
jgi:Domain of unknown function (DUF929)